MSKLDYTDYAAAFETDEADPRPNCWVIDTIQSALESGIKITPLIFQTSLPSEMPKSNLIKYLEVLQYANQVELNKKSGIPQKVSRKEREQEALLLYSNAIKPKQVKTTT